MDSESQQVLNCCHDYELKTQDHSSNMVHYKQCIHCGYTKMAYPLLIWQTADETFIGLPESYILEMLEDPGPIINTHWPFD